MIEDAIPAPIDAAAVPDAPAPVESVIVSAVGVAVGRGDTPSEISRAKTIETAMSDAIAQAQAEGITDPEMIRERILAARDKAQALGNGITPQLTTASTITES